MPIMPPSITYFWLYLDVGSDPSPNIIGKGTFRSMNRVFLFAMQRATGRLQLRMKKSKSGSNGSTWCNWRKAINRMVQYGTIQLPTWLANQTLIQKCWVGKNVGICSPH